MTHLARAGIQVNRKEVNVGPYERGCLNRPLEPREQREFLAQGYVKIGELWSAEFAEALAEEACSLMPSRAGEPVRPSRAAPSSQAIAADAPLLVQLHSSLTPLVRALTGRIYVPAFAWYNFYEIDDGIWLHVDIEGSELALLTTASGEVGPLHLHPELEGRTQDELDTVADDRGWNPNAGVPVAYPRLGVLAHRGRSVPHHRPARPISYPSAVAALHYSALV